MFNRRWATLPLCCIGLILGGCRTKVVRPPPDDKSAEILIQHLLNRATAADERVQLLQLELAKRGKRVPANQEAEWLNGLTQNLLDSEAAILGHNERHPGSQWGYSGGALRSICGECTEERKTWNARMAEETKKYEDSIRRPGGKPQP